MAFDAGAIAAEMVLDLDPFQRDLKKARALGREFERKPIKARLELVDKPFRATLAKARTAARRPINAKLDLNTKVAQARATAFRERAQRKIEVRVDLDDKLARARLAGLGGGSNASGLRMINRAIGGVASSFSQALGGIPVLGNIMGAALEGVTRGANFAGQALTQLLGRFSSLGSVVPSVAGQLATLVLNLAGMAAVAGGLVIALNAALGAVVALGGALVALVASLGAAVLGAGLLGAAFLATLGPAVLLGIGLFQRFHAIMETRQAKEQALKQAVLGQAQAEKTRRDALEQSRQAHQRVAEEFVAGQRAMRQSVLDLKDAELSRERAHLGVDQAKLQRDRARKDLKEFLREAGAGGKQLETLFGRLTDTAFHPGSARGLLEGTTGKSISGDKALELRQRILAVRDANLSYRESLNQVTHAEDNLNQAQTKRADFLKRGVRAYAPYRQAVAAAEKAHVRYVRALHATNRAQAEYERQLKKLTPAEKGALSRIDRLSKAWGALAKRFSDPVFRAVNDVFDRLSGKGSVFEGVLGKLGDAVADFVRAFGRFLTEPQSIKAFQVMGDGAAYLTRQLGSRAFINFLRIMRDLARATLPSLKRIAREIGDTFAGWARKTANVRDLRRNVVIPLVRNFRTWAGLAKDVLRLVGALFRVAAPEGRSLAESMRKIVQRWTRWINANPEKVRRFFREAIDRTKRIVHWIAQAVTWLRTRLPHAADVAKRAFDGIYRVVKKIVDAVGWIQNASTDIANAVGVGASPKDAATVARNDLAIVQRGMADLKKHLTPASRNAIRANVIEALRELLNRRGSVGRQFDISGGDRSRLQGMLDQLEHPTPRHRGPRRIVRTAAFAGAGGETHTHFHAHGIENVDHFIAKAARKLPRHPDFSKERRREVQRRGESN